MINGLLKEIDAAHIPIIVGELGEFVGKSDGCAYAHIVNEQLEDMGREKNIGLVSAKGLTDNGDALHFDASSLREFGSRYANAWVACGQSMGITLK